MYIVRDKRSKLVLHVNPAPLSQCLSGKDVYYEFSSESMEIVKSDLPTIPEHFHVDGEGMVVEYDLQAKVDAGVIALSSEVKIEHDQIVEKSLAEKVGEGLIELDHDQMAQGAESVRKTSRQLHDEGRMTLDEYMQDRIECFSRTAFQSRAALIKDYELQNAALGIYDSQTTANYKATVVAFRAEFHRLKSLVEAAKTAAEIDGIEEQYPRTIVSA